MIRPGPEKWIGLGLPQRAAGLRDELPDWTCTYNSSTSEPDLLQMNLSPQPPAPSAAGTDSDTGDHSWRKTHIRTQIINFIHLADAFIQVHVYKEYLGAGVNNREDHSHNIRNI